MDGASEQSLFEHLGGDALSYLLATDRDVLRLRLEDGQAHPLTALQEAVLVQLVGIDQQMQSWQPGHDTAGEWASRLGGASDSDPNVSLGNLARTVAGGDVTQVPGSVIDLERELMRLAVDCYPSLLVHESDDPMYRRVGLPTSLFRHPSNEAFQALAQQDSDLSQLYTTLREDSGPMGNVIRSTGVGGTIQLWTLADTLLSSAWAIACLEEEVPTADQFLESVQANVSTLRSTINHQPVTIPARIGIAGVLLPDGIDRIDLGWARIRRSDNRDGTYIRSTSLTGQLTGTNELGETAVINYSGDLVLEMDVPFAIQIGERDFMDPWPPEMLASRDALSEAVENVRLGLLLAFPDRRVVVHTSWNVMIDPFVRGRFAGSNDLTRAVGLMPTQLTSDQVNEWEFWAHRVGEHRTPTIGVAIRRMLASVAERRTMEDILVDAVIVWENLFGAATETTLRISSSLAWLLGTSRTDRKRRLARYKKIYGFRSKVVHGAPVVDPLKVQEYGFEAVQISIDALRSIFDTNVELLAVSSSEERSLEIMHRGEIT